MKITYNQGAILESADTVINNAAGMADSHQNVADRTNALLGDFSGINATTYADHQQQFLQAFDHLIQTVHKFGQTVHVVVGDASDTDNSLATMM